MPKSTKSALPTLERKPGGPDNWVERVGGLPQYIDRIARHLHYDKGMDISHAIATAVNTVKRWARKGTVVKYNDPKTNHVTLITAAQAAADVASWEAKKAMAGGGAGGGRSGRIRTKSIKLSEGPVELVALIKRAGEIDDPIARAHARRTIIDLALPKKEKCKYCASPATKRIIHAEGRAYIPVCANHLAKGKEAAMHVTPDGSRDPSNIDRVVDLAMTKDGRKSFKHRGKWKHGFIPVDSEAKTAKAKGSPVALKRMDRLYGKPAQVDRSTKAAIKKTMADRAKGAAAHGQQIRSNTGKKGGTQQERVQDVGQSQHADVRDAKPNQRAVLSSAEKSKGGGRTQRARQPWEQIPESQKTIRNGKRYIMATFDGRNILTEWVGENPSVAAPDLAKRQVLTMETSRLNQMSTAELRRMLKQGRLSPEVVKKANKILKIKAEQKAKRA